jgi:hypothetical protein
MRNPGAGAVDGHQRHQHQVWLDDRVTLGGLHQPEWAGLEWIAGNEAERLCGVDEAGECDDGANCTRLLHGGKRADLRSERMIAPDDRNTREQGSEVLRELLLESGPVRVAQSEHERLARVERRAT